MKRRSNLALPDKVRVAVVQNKPRKGDFQANLQSLREAFAQIASEDSVDLIVLPEAALTGYFLEGAVYDLAVSASRLADELAQAWQSTGSDNKVDIACGFYETDEGTFYNSALYLSVEPDLRRILHVHRKMFLPTYGVFDEERFLSRGRKLEVFETKFGHMALLVCEDAWHAIMPTICALKGARFIIIPSASPGRGISGKGELESVSHWRSLLINHAVEHGLYIIYASLTGFEGGKGMTGSSSIISPRGEIIVQAPALGSCILRATLQVGEIDIARANLPLLGDLRAVLPDLLLDDGLPLPRGVQSHSP
ncbi:MAG: beta-ureidopropionase [Candidatus Eremiobacteraeota bacterium]|nr:beta-ureidopropionase [Candidatus Eremiobacteraeota bacterium]